jgi:hypothetical protein
MNKTGLNDRDIRAAFLARSQGAPSTELPQRIAVDIRATRQRRRLLVLPGLAASPTATRLAWAAIVAAAALALLGLLAMGVGRQPNMIVVLPSASPTPELTAPPTSNATASLNIARSSQVQFVSDDGISVTIDIDDQSGQLVGAVKGEEGLITDPEVADVKFANPPGDATVLRVEWFSPAGCHEHYGLTIDPDARGITIHASYEVGGDSIGGNCGITLRFSDAVPASEVTGVLLNTPPT